MQTELLRRAKAVAAIARKMWIGQEVLIFLLTLHIFDTLCIS